MVKLKAFLLTADYIVLTISGYSFIDILSTMLTGNLALSSMENFVKLLFSIAGLVYLCVRIFNVMMKASLERDLMREEISPSKTRIIRIIPIVILKVNLMKITTKI